MNRQPQRARATDGAFAVLVFLFTFENEHGFVAKYGPALRETPEKRRPQRHEQLVEKAGEHFGGERLARVVAALDRAAGLPVPPDSPTAYADGKPPKPAIADATPAGRASA